MRFSFPREFYQPKGAIKIADKLSDAVAFLYTTHSGKPAAAVFFGRQAKPIAKYSYSNETQRREAVAALFKSRQARLALKLEQRAKRKDTPRSTEGGALYYTMWGYDQTNVDFYEVVDLVGAVSAKVRKIGAVDAGNGSEPWGTGKSVPAAGEYKGEAQTVRFVGDRFKIDGHSATRWQGRPVSWTNYS